MIRQIFFLILIISTASQAQQANDLNVSKKIIFTNDTIRLEKNSINNNNFKISDKNNNALNESFYKIDFAKATLLFDKNYVKTTDSITINYTKFPEFLTKEYSFYDSNRLVSNDAGKSSLYKAEEISTKKPSPFDGLNTSGSITRGLTIGNNQNSVVNSNLDLQITGKLSDKVSFRASIQDNNIPLQSGGYSQKLDQFDQIFIELFSDKWNVRAGDLFLENRKSRFLNFNKKVQGLSTNFTFGN